MKRLRRLLARWRLRRQPPVPPAPRWHVVTEGISWRDLTDARGRRRPRAGAGGAPRRLLAPPAPEAALVKGRPKVYVVDHAGLAAAAPDAVKRTMSEEARRRAQARLFPSVDRPLPAGTRTDLASGEERASGKSAERTAAFAKSRPRTSWRPRLGFGHVCDAACRGRRPRLATDSIRSAAPRPER